MTIRALEPPRRRPSRQPPGVAESVTAERVLVVAPHFDDEVLGCGGLLLRLRATSARVRVVFLSDGSGGVEAIDDRAAYATRRRDESRAVGERLGTEPARLLDLPDGRLIAHRDAIGSALAMEILEFAPDLLLLPSPLEISDDHRAGFLAFHERMAEVRSGDALWHRLRGARLLLYEVNHPGYPTLLVDVGAEVDQIRALMSLYASQEERHRYAEAAIGLRRYRALSLGAEVSAAEAFVEVDTAQLVLRTPAQLVTDLGGLPQLPEDDLGPSVSVIVRTRDRPHLLREALASIAASTHRRTELVLVNDGGVMPEIPQGFPFPVVRRDLESNRGRAAAANIGIDVAGGTHVCFLDDDDLAAPEHLSVLAGLVADGGTRLAYSDAAATILARDDSGTWQVRERRLPYSRDFDADFLLLDNYIPLNTLIIDRSLLREVGPLDVTFPFFEDWDLLIRLSRAVAFQHVRRVTCEYRMFVDAPHHVLGVDPRRRADFLRMKERILDKHRDLLSPDGLARAVDTMRAESVQLGDVREAHAAEARENAALRGRVGELEAALEAARRAQAAARPTDLSLARRLKQRLNRQLRG